MATPRSLFLVAIAAILGAPWPAAAQEVAGSVFQDLDADGVRDAGEPTIGAATVTLQAAGATVRAPMSGGAFRAVLPGPGCHALAVELPQDPDPAAFSPGTWRRALPSQAWSPLPGTAPVGIARWSAPLRLSQGLQAPGFKHVSMGDSIASGDSLCSLVFFQDTDYVDDVAANLRCLSAGAVTLERRAVPGSETDDLLAPEGGANGQYVAQVVASRPQLVTISIGGNDYLRSEPATAAGQAFPYAAAELEESFRELIDARRNIQEILSVLTSELPDADVVISTVYDNEARQCASTDFHAAAPTIWNQMLRHAAFGQRRPALVAETFYDFAHQDVLRAGCWGFQNQVCADRIHPSPSGTLIIEEAVMEALGRVDVPAASVVAGVDLGYEEMVATLYPTRVSSLRGTNPTDALTLDGSGSSMDFDGALLELDGFALPPGVTASHVVVGVRYRTTGVIVDDTHHVEASFVGFQPPAYTFTGWDTQTPLVGGAGSAAHGAGAPQAVVNVLPNVPAWREVSALVTLNALDDGRATGYFTWPSPTAADVARLAVKVRTEIVGANDGGSLEVDGAWAWVLGVRSAAAFPGEVSPPGAAVPLTVRKAPTGLQVAWQAEPASTTYRVHHGLVPDWGGSVVNPAVDRGGCTTSLSFVVPPAADSGADAFFLVSGVNAGGIAGPLGTWSDGTTLRTSGLSACP